MVEGLWTRLTSPITGLISGTYEQMGKRDFNPFKGDFNPFSGWDTIRATIIVVVIIIGVIIALPYLLTTGTAYRKYKGAGQ